MPTPFQSTVAPVPARAPCVRCRHADVVSLVPVGNRTCVRCASLRVRCRVARDNSALIRRFRSRMLALRSAITNVINTLDSVDALILEPLCWSFSSSPWFHLSDVFINSWPFGYFWYFGVRFGCCSCCRNS